MLRVLLAFLLLLLVVPAAHAQPASAPPADAAAGQRLFNDMGCWQCHGYQGQGGESGPRIGPQPLPWPVFDNYVRAPSGTMPPYRASVLGEADLRKIHAYLTSLPGPSPNAPRPR
ncbi:MAG: cytochrome c [Hyphomonadaceae bacterium]|nr:cytochrome c [Hyphomonadaceae bacterium]